MVTNKLTPEANGKTCSIFFDDLSSFLYKERALEQFISSDDLICVYSEAKNKQSKIRKGERLKNLRVIFMIH